VKAHTGSGNLTIEGVKLRGPLIDLHTASGNIRIE